MIPITGENGAPVIGCGQVTIKGDSILVTAMIEGQPLGQSGDPKLDIEKKIIEAVESVVREYVA